MLGEKLVSGAFRIVFLWGQVLSNLLSQRIVTANPRGIMAMAGAARLMLNWQIEYLLRAIIGIGLTYGGIYKKAQKKNKKKHTY